MKKKITLNLFPLLREGISMYRKGENKFLSYRRAEGSIHPTGETTFWKEMFTSSCEEGKGNKERKRRLQFPCTGGGNEAFPSSVFLEGEEIGTP